MPHPHIVALVSSGVRWTWTRSRGCLRMLQLGAKVTTGPFKMKASEVWRCNRHVMAQKTMSAKPNKSNGNGLVGRLEFVATLENVLRILAMSLNLLAKIDSVVGDELLVAQDCQKKLVDCMLDPFKHDVAQPRFVGDAGIHQVDLWSSGEPPHDLAKDHLIVVWMERDIDSLCLARRLWLLGVRVLGQAIECIGNHFCSHKKPPLYCRYALLTRQHPGRLVPQAAR